MQAQPLNRTGHTYVVSAMVTTAVVIAVIVMFITGMRHAPLSLWPRVLFGWLSATIAEKPAAGWTGLGVAALLIALSARLAAWAARKTPACVTPQEDASALAGVGYFLRDVTIGVVRVGLEIVFSVQM
jgi:hypothetical protein